VAAVVVRADTDAADGILIGAVVGGVLADVDVATTAGVLLLLLVASLSEVDDDDDEVASVDNEAIAVATLLLSCSFSVLTIASVLRETAGDRLPLLFFFEITSL